MSENPNSELDTAELIGIVESTVEELKEYVREREFSDEELRQVLRAESSSKDRKTAKRFLRNRIDDLEETGEQEDAEEQQQETRKETGVEREDLLNMLGGTVEDVKEYVRENDPSDRELQDILHAEKMVKNRKTVVKFLKSYSKKKELEEEFHQAENDLKSLKQDLEAIEGELFDENAELDLDKLPDSATDETSEEGAGREGDAEGHSAEDEEVPEAEEGGSKEAEEDEEAEEDDSGDKEEPGENTAESEEAGNEIENDSDEEAGKAGGEGEDSENPDKEATDGESELGEKEQKQQLLEEMELELTEEELEQISLEELKKLAEEKDQRENLIDSLSQKFDREQLEKMTTEDLEKLADELGGIQDLPREEKMQQEKQKKDEEAKAEEELRKEAQEDLEMMMGAVRSENGDEEDSEPGAMDQLKQLPDRLKQVASRGGGDEEEEEESGFDRDKILEVLEEYRQLDDRESAVKTAQVMKGYLEYALEIDRELTYAELADKLEEQDKEDDYLQTLTEFYRSMKISVYTGDVEIDNMEEVLESAKTAVKELG